MKYPNIVEALDRILYLNGKLGISHQKHRKQLLTVTHCKTQEIS